MNEFSFRIIFDTFKNVQESSHPFFLFPNVEFILITLNCACSLNLPPPKVNRNGFKRHHVFYSHRYKQKKEIFGVTLFYSQMCNQMSVKLKL